MKIYELIPTNGRKSFYGKARVIVDDNGTELLISYNSPILSKTTNGEYKRYYDGDYTPTTATHVKTFCGMTKKEFEALPVEDISIRFA